MSSMDQVMALLLEERAKLERAIAALQGEVKRRGRPPKSLSAQPSGAEGHGGKATKPVKTRKKWSAAKRMAQASRMKTFWAAKRKAAK